MNLQKGLNRVFILLGLVAGGFGCMFGGTYAVSHWEPSLQEAFQSIDWNEQENINKYYLAAKNIAKIDEELKAKAENDDAMGGLMKAAYDSVERIKTEDLPNYKKIPPQYNGQVLREAFPDALKTPVYKVWLGIVLGALLAFCICYGGLHSIRLVIKWIISGFKD